MAKTRAQRKAERRRREEEAAKKRAAGSSESSAGAASSAESHAQQATQRPISGEVAEVEAVIETGARTEDYGEHTVSHAAQPTAPERPAEVDAASVPDVEKDSREERRERKRREKEERRKERAKQLRKEKDQPAEGSKPERRRGRVWAFLVSCWAELKKVQWPDRDTLIQASAVTILFVAVAAAYLGALDFVFNWLVKLILPG